MKKIGIFFGGKVSKHLSMIKRAGVKLGLDVELVSYNRVFFDTNSCQVKIRNENLGKIVFENLSKYDVCFFRTTGKHWEEVGLVMEAIDKNKTVVVDPLVWKGKPSLALKAWQMLRLKKEGIDVPESIYGSLQFLRLEAGNYFKFPFIIKGSGGDRGTRVYKVDNQTELDSLVASLRQVEISEGRRFMAQEYIENDGDYRVLVLGEKVLGVMKRSSQNKSEFRNNYSAGGKVEVADLPDNIKELAVKAAHGCGLMVAGVDVAFRDFDKNRPVVWEVNKGPQFAGFMKATGIDVPSEIVKFLEGLEIGEYKKNWGEWM